MEKRKSRSLRDRLMVPTFLFVLAPLAVFAVVKFIFSRPPASPASPASPAVEQAPKPRHEVTLYFGAPAGTYLLAEGRDIEDCPTDRDCVAAVVRALIEGPAGDLVPILPAHVALREVAIVDGTAVLDFSSDLISAHPGGSISELLTVYGLADTLAVNFPHLRQVRILVEGQGVDTLAGHVSLREPVTADFGFAQPPQEIEQQENAPAGDGEVVTDRMEGR